MPELTPRNVYVHVPLTGEEKSGLLSQFQPSERGTVAQDLTADEQRAHCQQAEVIFGNVPLDWLRETPALRWLQLNSAGLDPYHRFDWSQRPDVTVTNLHGLFGEPCAETVLAGILALYRGIVPLTDWQRRGEWVGGKLRPSLQLLQGKQALVLGAGAIGQRVGYLLAAFGCTLTHLRRSRVPTLAELDDRLPQADVVISTLPETPETVHLLDARRLSRMKAGSLFVNMGRGSVVDEAALAEVLRHGPLAGAVLDVTTVEPLPTDSPLWALPNVVLTQHTGGGYAGEKRDKLRVFTENLRRYRAGEPLAHVVNFGKGY
jgi:phosphoglycerate dehydrogenase-like enzyme